MMLRSRYSQEYVLFLLILFYRCLLRIRMFYFFFWVLLGIFEGEIHMFVLDITNKHEFDDNSLEWVKLYNALHMQKCRIQNGALTDYVFSIHSVFTFPFNRMKIKILWKHRLRSCQHTRKKTHSGGAQVIWLSHKPKQIV